MTVSRETHESPQRAPTGQFESLAEWLGDSAGLLGFTNYPDSQTTMTQAVLPALALLQLLGRHPVGAWADIGAGAGALGLTLACASPAAHFDLVDRRRRVVAFLDLTIARLAIRNAASQQESLSAAPPEPRWIGVCFRALSTPEDALALAAAHARRWVCAWHAEHIAAYDAPPPDFRLVARAPTQAPALVATLYEREAH